jgi:hypothetical protein
MAYHEAGHVVHGSLLKLHADRVSIVPDYGGPDGPASYGRVTLDPFPAWARRGRASPGRVQLLVERHVGMIAAGAIAETHYAGDSEGGWARARSDRERMYDLAGLVCRSSDEADAYVGWLTVRTRRVVTGEISWRIIEAVATALLHHGALSARAIRRTIAGAYEAIWRPMADSLAGTPGQPEEIAQLGEPEMAPPQLAQLGAADVHDIGMVTATE